MSQSLSIKVIRDNPRFVSQPSAVTIGNFDGVHIGHQRLITHMVNHAQQLNLIPTVVTFEPLPQAVLSGKTVEQLSPLRQKIGLFRDLGVQQVLCLRFGQALAALTPRTFIEHVLVQQLRAAFVTVGEEFEFGFKKQGDVGTLMLAASQYGFQFDALRIEKNKVGSSQIRQAINNQDLGLAKTLLGRDYGITARVKHGRKLGRQWGVPTANLNVKNHHCLVRGVYVTQVFIDGAAYYGVANIGFRPTLKQKRLVAEVHILNYDNDLYGKILDMVFVHKLRDEQRFESLPLLVEQIHRDVDAAKDYVAQLAQEQLQREKIAS